jgi:hypothetical protein
VGFMTTELTGVVADHITAVNAHDIDAIVATFAEDAYVNDNHREIRGIDGTYDKTNLPDELILSNYFSVRNGRIVSLVVIHNGPSEF